MTKYSLHCLLAVITLSAVPETTAQYHQSFLDPHPNQMMNAQLGFDIFDYELLKFTAETTNGNFIISPASIKLVLGMILKGTRGEGARQLQETLRIPKNDTETSNYLWSNLLRKLRVMSNGLTVDTANKIYVSNRYEINKIFANNIKAWNVDLQSADFTQPKRVANEINQWVNQITRGKITELVGPESFNIDATMVLANAVYFKGAWKNKFNEKLTKNACFYVSNTCQNVNMMETTADFNYSYIPELASQAVELPYLGDKYSMVLIVPSDRNGLTNAFVTNVVYYSLPRIINDLDTTEVKINFPKFDVKYSEDMVNILKKMGIRDIFDNSANLKGIFNSDTSPHIDNIVHKTRLEVNEEGSVASAASAAMVIPLMGTSTATMNVDRPFLFFIRDRETGVILFEGRVNQPNPASSHVVQPVRQPSRPLRTQNEYEPNNYQSNGDNLRTQTNDDQYKFSNNQPTANSQSNNQPKPQTDFVFATTANNNNNQNANLYGNRNVAQPTSSGQVSYPDQFGNRNIQLSTSNSQVNYPDQYNNRNVQQATANGQVNYPTNQRRNSQLSQIATDLYSGLGPREDN